MLRVENERAQEDEYKNEIKYATHSFLESSLFSCRIWIRFDCNIFMWNVECWNLDITPTTLYKIQRCTVKILDKVKGIANCEWNEVEIRQEGNTTNERERARANIVHTDQLNMCNV